MSGATTPTGSTERDGTFDQFRFALDSVAIGMALVGFDGRFLRVNPALCDLLDTPSEELLETTWASVTHPDDVPAGEAHVRRMEAGGEDSFQLEKRYLRRDGSVVWAMLNVSLVRSSSSEPLCMFTQVMDMTQYRRGEEARNRLAAIADASDDAIVGMTVDGTITAWNHGAENIYGYSADEAIGRHVSMLVPHEAREGFERHLESVHGRGRVERPETVCSPKYGPPIDVSATLSPIRDGAGNVTGVSFVARDITEKRWLAATLDATLTALEEALAQARESDARSRRFLADAAHQLRTPIAGIQACAETLLRGAPKEEVDRILMHLLRETSRATRLMGSLLRMARLDQGESLAPKRCNLLALCTDEAERARTLAPELEITVRAEGMTEHRPSLDSHAVREILANLLDNARRYASSRIEVLLRQFEARVEIRVTDDGPGLSDDMVDRAFERFVTFDSKAGSGLGLPIARELARAHGGDLTYENGSFVTVLAALPPEERAAAARP